MPDVSVQEFEAGDRVRLLANIGDLLEGQKGTVLATQDDQLEMRADGSLDDYLVPADKVERIIPLTKTEVPPLPDDAELGGITAARARELGWTEDEIQSAAAAAKAGLSQELATGLVSQASTGNMEMTRALYDVRFVRSGTPEELLEVEKHLRMMIDQGLAYRFMERFLMTMGYLPHTIRRAFKNLTGVRPEDVVNYENYFMSPGCIPTFNMGWGKAKGKDKGFFFIMPMTDYYGIFHQVDDRTRVEVSRHPELQDAIEACRKLVVRLERWDPPVKDVKRPDVVPSEMYRQPQLYMSASAIQLAELFQTTYSKPLRVGLITTAFRSGAITDTERRYLLSIYADGDVLETEKKEQGVEEQRKAEKDAMKKLTPGEEKTPDESLGEVVEEDRQFELTPSDVDKFAREFFEKLQQSFPEFRFTHRESKYSVKRPLGKKNMSDERDVLNAIGQLEVYFYVFDTTVPVVKGQNPKVAGTVFTRGADQKTIPPEHFKSQDGQEYAFDEGGLLALFEKERAAQS